MRIRRAQCRLIACRQVAFHPGDVLHNRVALGHDFHDPCNLAIGIHALAQVRKSQCGVTVSHSLAS